MANILENSLVMVVLAAFIIIPVFIIRLNNKKKKQAIIQSKLNGIASDNNLVLTRKHEIGNLLVGLSSSQKLLILNTLDFTFEIIDIDNITNVKKDISYNGKEIKNIKITLQIKEGITKDIDRKSVV